MNTNIVINKSDYFIMQISNIKKLVSAKATGLFKKKILKTLSSQPSIINFN